MYLDLLNEKPIQYKIPGLRKIKKKTVKNAAVAETDLSGDSIQLNPS